MHRYLITGASGFVAQHFLAFLQETEPDCTALGLDVHPSSSGTFQFPYEAGVLDLLDGPAIEKVVLDFRPTRILHLASFSSVGASWKAPVDSFTNNTNIFLNLLEPLRKHGLSARLLSVGSSEEYGSVLPADLPLGETKALNPGSPYGVARVAQEQLSKVFAEGYGTDVVMTRSFNHMGPGQRDQFVIPSFVRQVVQARRMGSKVCLIRSGNTAVVRDFLDVRDVVRAYHGLFERGRKGEVYNICSGTGRSLDEVLSLLSEITGVSIEKETDPTLLRPNELMEIVGSPSKIKSELGWGPRYDFRSSLIDLVAYWEQKLGEQERSPRENQR